MHRDVAEQAAVLFNALLDKDARLRRQVTAYPLVLQAIRCYQRRRAAAERV